VARNAEDRVDLTELDVISRYSLAVRTATVSRDELITVLRDDLRWLEGGRATRSASTAKTSRPAAPKKAAATSAAAKSARSAPTGKATAKSTSRRAR
jgi:hypothetical protein